MSHDNGQTHQNVRGSPQDSKTETVILRHEQSCHEPQQGLDTKRDWLGVCQS